MDNVGAVPSVNTLTVAVYSASSLRGGPGPGLDQGWQCLHLPWLRPHPDDRISCLVAPVVFGFSSHVRMLSCRRSSHGSGFKTTAQSPARFPWRDTNRRPSDGLHHGVYFIGEDDASCGDQRGFPGSRHELIQENGQDLCGYGFVRFTASRRLHFNRPVCNTDVRMRLPKGVQES